MTEELEESIYEEYPIPHFKSKRIPDVHGGQPDASAEPDHRMSKMEVQQPFTEHVYRRRQENIMKSIHGESEPKAHLPVLINMHNTQIELLKTMKDVRELLAMQVPLGQTRGFNLNFASGAHMVHIDFQDPTQSYYTSGMAPIGEPGRKLTSLQLISVSSGVVQFSTNLPKSDQTADVLLNPTSASFPAFTASFEQPIIWSLNIVPVSGQPNIRGVYTF